MQRTRRVAREEKKKEKGEEKKKLPLTLSENIVKSLKEMEEKIAPQSEEEEWIDKLLLGLAGVGAACVVGGVAAVAISECKARSERKRLTQDTQPKRKKDGASRGALNAHDRFKSY